MGIRTRFAPSPTGFLHIGGLRTALYNYIYAKKNKGNCILRIEDTDRNRLVKNATNSLIKSLNYFDIDFDESPGKNEIYGPYKQSERLDIYKEHYITLIKNKSAYVCHTNNGELIPEYDIQKALEKLENKDKDCVIKLKIPALGILETFDQLRGKVDFDLSLIEDPIIIKTDGYPTYHFANVVDDYLMKITHVIRGEEWLPSLPKHIILYKSFGWVSPKFIHLPLLLNPDRSKLSKRHGDTNIVDFIKKGYLKDSIINFIALLGWHPDDDEEIFNIKKLIKNFSIKKIQKSGAIFDTNKLNWMNSVYIKNLELGSFIKLYQKNYLECNYDFSDKEKLTKVFTYIKQRISRLDEISKLLIPFYENIILDNQEIIDLINSENSKLIFNYWHKNLSDTSILNKDIVNKLIKESEQELNCKGKNLFYPLRAVLFGEFNGPDLYTIISILGINETKKRLKSYIE